MSYASRKRNAILRKLLFISVLLTIGAIGVYALLFRETVEIAADNDFQNRLITALNTAKPGEVVEVPEGRYYLDQPLQLAAEGVTLRGVGNNKSILSFRPLDSAQPAITVSADSASIINLAVVDAPGPAITTLNARNVTIRGNAISTQRIRKRPAGTIGISALRSQNLLIEDNLIQGAVNAGILLMDSDNAVVNNNRLSANVIGIEVASSRLVELNGNTITGNSSGILLIDLPGQAATQGGTITIQSSEIFANNRSSLDAPTELSKFIYNGSGIVVLGMDKVEIFDNEIYRHNAGNILVLSRDPDQFPNLDGFDAFAEGINIRNNRLSESGMGPSELLTKYGGVSLSLPYPDIFYDGRVSPRAMDGGRRNAAYSLCLHENSALRIANLDLSDVYGGITRQLGPLECLLPSVERVVLPLTMR